MYFVLNAVKATRTGPDAMNAYASELLALAQKHGGDFQIPMLTITDQLTYEATPAHFVAFDYTHFFVLRFDNKKGARQMLADAAFTLERQHFERHTVVETKTMRMPGLPAFPTIQTSDIKPPPSFVLLNPIKMKKSPRAMFNMLRYFKQNGPKVADAGTEFFALFRRVKVVKGDFDFDMIFLPVWTGIAAFDAIHSGNFFAKVVPLRNNAVKAMADAHAVHQPS